MKAQEIVFKRTKNAEYEDGIAIVKLFGLTDGMIVLDEDGDKVTKIYDCKLQDGPLAYLDTEYLEESPQVQYLIIYDETQ